jgi:hypothetical protein
MSIRRDPIYLSSEIWRALWILAKSKSPKEGERLMTADEMADEMLREAIKLHFPQLLEHQKQVAKMETDLVKSLGGAVQ